MKVFAINGSPKSDKGNTHAILQPFLDGMRAAGATINLFYTKKLTIQPCQGEFNCMFKHPGRCFIQDDMQSLYPKLAEADIWVLATPLYVDSMSAPLKQMLDRANPLSLPFFEDFNGQTGHPWRESTRVSKMVLVSNCGFPELRNFDPLVQQIQRMCEHTGRNGISTEFAGALLRPNGPYLLPLKEAGVPLDDIFQAAWEAGRQLVSNGKISPETLQTISRGLTPQPKESFLEEANHFLRQRLATLEAPVECTHLSDKDNRKAY